MRILEIRFKNLNSLTGEWFIDFTHPAFIADGIFAITGPTGAGKTTILDAVCLALYGCTPRLNRVTRGGNEIMSRQTGECFAETLFETPAGRYRCHWRQHRARRRPSGELQPPSHEVADADSGKVLQSKLRDTADFIEAATGMDFERFTRSMLLAQGGFAAFLQAPPDGRAPILEQITGTGIYSRISMKVHQLRADEHKKLGIMTAELEGLQLLSDDERRELAQALEAGKQSEAALALEIDGFKKAVAWLEDLRELEKRLATMEGRQRDFEQRKKAFQPLRVRLERARQARELEADAARTDALEAEQKKEMAALDAAQRELPKLESALARAVKLEKSASQELEQKRQYQQAQAAVIRKVREMDVRIENRHSRVEAVEASIRKAEKKGQVFRRRLSKLETSVKERRAAIAEIARYLEQHAADASLVENMAAIERLFGALKEKSAALTDARRALKQALAEIDAVGSRLKGEETVFHRCREQLEQDREAFLQADRLIVRLLAGRQPSDWHRELERLRDRKHLLQKLGEILQRRKQASRAIADADARLGQLRSETAALPEKIRRKQAEEGALKREVQHLETEVTLLGRIRDLEEERRRLEDGQPCPLCGATEHPWAAGNTPVSDSSRTALEAARRAQTQATEAVTALRVKQAGTAKDLRQAEERRQTLRTDLAADERQCREIRASLELHEDAAEQPEAVDSERESINRRMAAVSETLRKVEDETGRREMLRKSLEAAEKALTDAQKALQDARHRQDTTRREHRRLEGECASLKKQVEALLQEAAETLRGYDAGDVSLERLDSLSGLLRERRNRWQQKRRDRQAGEKDLATLEKDAEKQQALMDSMAAELRSRHEERRLLYRKLEDQVGERRQLYGGRNPDQEERRLAEGVQAAEKAHEAGRRACAALVQKTGRVKEKIRLLETATRDRAAELTAARQILLEKLQRSGFKDEADFREACLPARELKKLSAQEKDLQREETELLARLTDTKATLKARRAERITEASLAELAAKLAGAETAHREVQQKIGAIGERLAQDRQQRKRRREYLKQLEKQKKECVRWDALHGLIGSADGKKYRNFAQGLTFEIMIAHANRQLAGMTDRYLLIRDKAQPLELDVIDNYQAGEIRSTKNLSGGESFIVSLALALGLSQMASRNVRVDSLFLDEGFGTLDQDALETALETLAGLQQAGKLIGVIHRCDFPRAGVKGAHRHADPGDP